MALAFLKSWWKKLFGSKACKHRFDSATVLNWNEEPKCKLCGMYFSAIYAIHPHRFTVLNEKEYGLEKVKIR